MATLATNGRDAGVEAITDLLDAGDIRFETAANAEVAVCTFAATAFGAAATGVVTAAAIADDTTAVAGTIDHALLRTGAAATVITATCAVGSGDFNFTSLVIGTGDTVSVTSLTVTMPAS